MTIHAPQAILVFILIVSLGIEMSRHGQQKTGSIARYNFWTMAISAGINMGLLYWGGFFR